MEEQLYKFTDESGRTLHACQWGPGVTHEAPGGGDLCTSAWLHAYRDPALAVFLAPFHLDYPAARLWECEGEVGADDGTKVGCTRLTTIHEVPVPTVTRTQRVEFAIRCALEVCEDEDWRAWAQAWLSGEDRTPATARAAARKTWGWAEEAWAAAEATARAAFAGAEATTAVLAAATAALAAKSAINARPELNLVTIARQFVC